MQLIVTKHNTDTIIAIEVPDDADMEIVTQMIQAEMGIPIPEQLLEFEDSPLQLGVLAAQGVVDGSTITVKQVSASQQQASQQHASSSHGSSHGNNQHQLVDPGSVAPERLMEIVQQNPAMLQQYKRLDAELGAVLESGDVSKLRVFIMKRLMNRHKIVYEARHEEIALQTADPMDPETQRKIAEKVSAHVL